MTDESGRYGGSKQQLHHKSVSGLGSQGEVAQVRGKSGVGVVFLLTHGKGNRNLSYFPTGSRWGRSNTKLGGGLLWMMIRLAGDGGPFQLTRLARGN